MAPFYKINYHWHRKSINVKLTKNPFKENDR